MKKAAFHTLGCKVNSYETEAMQQLLEDAGYETAPFAPGADIYIINTCSVTNVADKKSRQMLHRAKKLNPDAVVVAVGCYVQAAAETLERDEAVDLVIGNDKKKEIVSILETYFARREEEKDRVEHTVIDISASREYETLSIRKIADHTRAFIKIQDGCNQFCSYCIIPYTRGRVRSRRAEDVLREVETLAAAGYHEVVLTGIHLSSYGMDFERESAPDQDRASYDSWEERGRRLLDLIRRIDGIPGVERIRLGSLEPRIITPEFAGGLAAVKSICPHFHLSLQSGCDATLKRMNRHYTAKEYLNRCGVLRRFFENPAVTTDVIVGFPGETEEEFAQTEAFLETVRFYELHVFKYSRRGGTRAASMENQVSETVKNVRSDRLLALDQRLSLEYRRSFLGKEEELLLEEPVDIGGVRYMVGHTRQYVKGAVPCGVEEGQLKNQIIRGRFTRMLSEEVLLLETESSGL